MDFLDLHHDYADGYEINFAIPRICHVKKEDFKYIMDVDFDVSKRHHRPPYGVLSVGLYHCCLFVYLSSHNVYSSCLFVYSVEVFVYFSVQMKSTFIYLFSFITVERCFFYALCCCFLWQQLCT